MSDVSVLSQEYRTAAHLSQAINHSLIALKKVRLGVADAEMLPPEQLREFRADLAEIVSALIGLLDPEGKKPLDSRSAIRLPGALVGRMRERHSGDLGYYLEDLARLAERLAIAPETLTERDIALVDEIAAETDAETSQVFRRLMRK